MAQKGEQNGVVSNPQNAQSLLSNPECLCFDGSKKFGEEGVNDAVKEGEEGGVTVGDDSVQVFDVGYGEMGLG